MFELPHPTRCLEWTRNGSGRSMMDSNAAASLPPSLQGVCVAGFSEEIQNEILQLSLPEKLLPPEEQVR